ncbi:hypothetical protein E1166_02995 [Micromonospora sp. KC213]|nr:hypothetical protein E1166_02995 [Micromonospora sp. KC213]
MTEGAASPQSEALPRASAISRTAVCLGALAGPVLAWQPLRSWPLEGRAVEPDEEYGDTVGSWLNAWPAPGSDTSSSSTVCRSTGG